LSQIAVYSNLGRDFIRFKVITSDNNQIITKITYKHTGRWVAEETVLENDVACMWGMYCFARRLLTNLVHSVLTDCVISRPKSMIMFVFCIRIQYWRWHCKSKSFVSSWNQRGRHQRVGFYCITMVVMSVHPHFRRLLHVDGITTRSANQRSATWCEGEV